MIASGALKVLITGFWHFWVLTIQQQLLPHYVSLFWGMLGSHFGNQIWHMKILIWMLYSQHSLATTWIKESLFDQKLDQILTRNSWSSLSQIIQNLSRPSLFWDFAPSLYWVNFFLSFWGLTRLSPNLHQNGYVKAWCTTNKPCIVYNRSKFWVTLGHF